MGFWVGVSRLEAAALLFFFIQPPCGNFNFIYRRIKKNILNLFCELLYGAQLNAPDAALEAIANKRMIKKILVVVTTCTVMVK